MTMTTRGVIFDMDGVLVESTEAHYLAWKHLGEQVGKPYSRALFDKTYGMHNRQTIPLWLGRAVSEEELARLGDEKEEHYREAARTSLQPLPGVLQLIDSLLASHFVIAVGSSGPSGNVALGLQTLGIAEKFKAIVSGDDVKLGKPHPDIFSLAAQRLGLSPDRCLVFEDAPPGVEAAHAAGMPCIAITSSRQAIELKGAERIIERFSEVDPLIVNQTIDNFKTASNRGEA